VLRFVGRRLAATVPTLFVVSLIIFAIVHLAPGDPAQLILGEDATPQALASLRAALGEDKPLPVQYVAWLSAFVRGDMGRSLSTNEPVVHAIASRIPVTLELTIFALVVAIAIGIPLGIVAALRRGGPVDVLATGIALIGVSLPTFVFALLGILVFSLWLRVLPPTGYVPFWDDPLRNLKLMLMPSVVLGAALAGILARLTRSGMLETLGADFVRTARAKGLAEGAVILRHALRNALLPVVTIVGIEAGTLLGGAIVTETVFTLPGVGKLVVDSIFARDFPLVQATIVFLALARIAANLLADIVFAALDPRIALR
jgi:peptide/nickel transport system permease protein